MDNNKMNDSLSIGSVSDQDEDYENHRMQYIQQDSLQPINNNSNNDNGNRSEDDDSSKLFFVSPSTSVSDSSENLMRLGALVDENDNLLHIDPSASGEEENHLLFQHSEQQGLLPNESNDSGSSSRIVSMRAFEAGAPPLPAANTTATKNYASPTRVARSSPVVAYSPDNMSLSSHETASSEGPSKPKVELDFIPAMQQQQVTNNNKSTLMAPKEVKTRGDQKVPGRKRAKGNYKAKAKTVPSDASSNSSSSASETQVKQLGEFLDDLRINSQGQMRESSVPGSNTSFESSIMVTKETEVEDVLRQNSALYGRRKTGRYPNAAVSSRESSASRLSMDYTKDSRSAADSPSAENYRHKTDALVGDTIEIMVPTTAAPLPLPPLYTPTSNSGRKQPHDRQRRSSADAEPDTNSNSRNNSLKSTIENSGEEWSQQQKEIGLFSQFALGTIDAEGGRGGHRSKQRSYRQVKTRHSRQESGEDSSSHASSEHSYVNFFHSPSPPQQPQSQPPIDPGYQPNPLPTPRILPHGQGRTPASGGSSHATFNMSPRQRPIQNSSSFTPNEPSSIHPGSAPAFITSYDGSHPTVRQPSSYDGSHPPVRQPPPPLQLDSTNSASMPWGNPIYQSSPTYYFPGHKRGFSEVPGMNQRFQFELSNANHLHYPQTRSHSAASQQYDNSPDAVGNSYHFPHSQQQFSAMANHVTTPIYANQFFAEESNRNRNHSYDSSSHKTGSVDHDLQKFQMEQQRRDSYVFDDDTSYSVSDHSSDESIEKERDIHLLHGRSHHDNRVIRHHHFDEAIPKFDRRQFLPQTSTVSDNAGDSKYPTFVCPNCKMRQREFFTVSSAPRQYESEGTMLSLLFAVYVVASLYIFGLQEGWGKLDCFYFAVITLTTAGLGDLVPTTDGAKIMCSMFIYFGVACIGLLLGSYIAGMLDERSYREAVANQISACPNCARIKNMQYMAEQRRSGFPTANDKFSMEQIAEKHAASLHRNKAMERAPKKIRRTEAEISASQSMEKEKEELLSTTPKTPSSFESPTVQKKLLGSPMTTQILHRQSHTRHVSMDLRGSSGKTRGTSRSNLDINNVRFRNNSADVHIPATVKEGAQSAYRAKDSTSGSNDTEKENQDANVSTEPPLKPRESEMPQRTTQKEVSDGSISDDSDSYLDSLDSEIEEIEGRNSGVRNAKYVIYTLREALVNSLVIIAFGCLGFYLIEGFSFVDSLYFTTVLLTSTGYGDIVPTSDGGKLFATVYLLVGGTILLHNMSMISMIPLELRKRRTEYSVLTQFGDSLDDDALRELATGPLIQRINLGGKDPRGLDECTREMFALAMMIRLGKVTEHDIKLTFAAFRKLDVHNEGILNSKSIIGGMIQKRRRNLLTNRNNNGGPEQNSRYFGTSQGYGSWINYPVPSNVDAPRNRSSSTHSSYVPSSHEHNVHHSDHAPLLSMSDRGFPQYGMNQQTPFVPTLNE